MRITYLLPSLFGILFNLGLLGCSSEDPPAACQSFNYASYTAPTTPVTLKDHVYPQVFVPSCALSSSCHVNGSIHPPQLGPMNGIIDAAGLQVIMSELSRASAQVPSRKQVVPGKPEDSYLMNKIDGSNDCSGFACVGPDGCGVQMPQLVAAGLEPALVKMVRDWIKQGAM